MTSASKPDGSSELEFPWLSIDAWFQFPDPEDAKNGIVGHGGNLSPGMLLSAYMQGIFPWYSEDDPLLWWAPNPRFVLLPNELHVSKSIERLIKKQTFVYTMDAVFEQVIAQCAYAKRPDQEGTWILNEVIEGYTEFHALGYAHSFEAWQIDEHGNKKLAGGFYGVLIGQVFFGESMFTLMPDASKCAFVSFARHFADCGGKLIDSQIYTDHVARFGGKNISRDAFLHLEELYLNKKLEKDLKEKY